MNKKSIIILTIISTISTLYAIVFYIFHKPTQTISIIINNKFVYQLTIKQYLDILRNSPLKSLRIKLRLAFTEIKYISVFLNEKEDEVFRDLYAKIVY